ncbi:uncharacterized protein [Ambystoma mexicanum]
MGHAELKRRVEQLKAEMQKVSRYSREAKCMRTSTSERLDSGHSTRSFNSPSCYSTTFQAPAPYPREHPPSVSAAPPFSGTLSSVAAPPRSSIPFIVTPVHARHSSPISVATSSDVPPCVLPPVTPSHVPSEPRLCVPTSDLARPPVRPFYGPAPTTSHPATPFFVSTNLLSVSSPAIPSTVASPLPMMPVPACSFPLPVTYSFIEVRSSSQLPSVPPFSGPSLSHSHTVIDCPVRGHSPHVSLPVSAPSPLESPPGGISPPFSSRTDPVTHSSVPAPPPFQSDPLVPSSVPVRPASHPDPVTASTTPSPPIVHAEELIDASAPVRPDSHPDPVTPCSGPAPPTCPSEPATPSCVPVCPSHLDLELPSRPPSPASSHIDHEMPPCSPTLPLPHHDPGIPSSVQAPSSSHFSPTTHAHVSSASCTTPLTPCIPAPSPIPPSSSSIPFGSLYNPAPPRSQPNHGTHSCNAAPLPIHLDPWKASAVASIHLRRSPEMRISHPDPITSFSVCSPPPAPPLPPPAPPLPPPAPPLLSTPLQHRIKSRQTLSTATPDLLASYGLGKLNNTSLMDQSPGTTIAGGSKDNLSSLQAELQAGNHTNRLRNTGMIRSPGGTPMMDSSVTSTPSLSFNTSLLTKFQNANSPETSGSDSENSGFETPSATPNGTP